MRAALDLPASSLASTATGVARRWCPGPAMAAQAPAGMAGLAGAGPGPLQLGVAAGNGGSGQHPKGTRPLASGGQKQPPSNWPSNWLEFIWWVLWMYVVVQALVSAVRFPNIDAGKPKRGATIGTANTDKASSSGQAN